MHFLSLLLAVLPVLNGPDARLQVRFSDDGGRLRYEIACEGRTLLAPSLLGLQTDDADYTRLEVLSADSEDIRDSYVLDRIKASRTAGSSTSNGT